MRCGWLDDGIERAWFCGVWHLVVMPGSCRQAAAWYPWRGWSSWLLVTSLVTGEPVYWLSGSPVFYFEPDSRL